MSVTLYLLKLNKFYKIGITSDLKNRLNQYRTHNPYDVKLVATKLWQNRDDALNVEQQIITEYSDQCHRGEWFVFDKETIEKVLVYFEDYGKPKNFEYDPYKQNWVTVFFNPKNVNNYEKIASYIQGDYSPHQQ